MEWRDRIVCNPDILAGKPIVKGTRISVELLLGWLGTGRTIDDVLESYSHLTREDVLAALSYACEYMREERYVRLTPAA